MKKYAVRSLFLPSFLAMALFLAGCAGSSPPSRFYTLNSMIDGSPGGSAAQIEITQLFSIGPVDIAEYLDRPQIVTRTSENHIRFDEFDRWGGSLKGEISRVLVDNLTVLLAKDGIMAVPWRTTYRGTLISIPVSIQRLDGAPGGSLTLQARWAVLSKDTKSVKTVRESHYIVPVTGEGYEPMVHAMSEALGKLSDEIAPIVKSIMSQPPQTVVTDPPKKN